ncbi:hypothetical protein [Rhodanobacter sp. C05]|uniref:hypothetical protein n=1 Tax=Rhodanobacter sp. C05 TaxID=1945855 RepID=UPI00117A1B72|nr:hypothetical protein [Rhodanobacter sp. C05]
MGVIAEPLAAGDWVEALGAGAIVGAAAVAAGGGVAGTCEAESSVLPHALRANMAPSEMVHIRVWRVIFIENLLLRANNKRICIGGMDVVIPSMGLTSRVHEGKTAHTTSTGADPELTCHTRVINRAR